MFKLDYFAPGYKYDLDTIRADVQDIPLQDKSLDIIIILHVLEHVPNVTKAIRELRRVLHPGGLLLHETPCFSI